MPELDRRRFLRIAAASTAVGVAGCSQDDAGASTDEMDEEMTEAMDDGDMTESMGGEEMTESMDGEEMTEAITEEEMTEAMTEEEMTEAMDDDAMTEAMDDETATDDGTMALQTFEVTVTNVSEPGTITTSEGDDVAVPLSPMAYAVHSGDARLFEEGESAGDGLESLAEDGHPGAFATEVEMTDGVQNADAVATPDEAAPLFPGESYSFEVEAGHDHGLSLATMFVQSNDLFHAPEPSGIALFDGAEPVDGDVTDDFVLWDAGTEVNQEPGVGADQAPRQSGDDTGADEDATIRPVDDVMDEYEYPDTSEVIEVTVSTL